MGWAKKPTPLHPNTCISIGCILGYFTMISSTNTYAESPCGARQEGIFAKGTTESLTYRAGVSGKSRVSSPRKFSACASASYFCEATWVKFSPSTETETVRLSGRKILEVWSRRIPAATLLTTSYFFISIVRSTGVPRHAAHDAVLNDSVPLNPSVRHPGRP